MSNAIERYYGSRGLHSLAVHPGVIQTELSRHLDPAFLAKLGEDTKMIAHLKSIEQGAATTVLAAIGKDFEGVGGKYLEDAGEWGPVQVENPTYEPGHASWAFDSGKEDRLWKDSLKFVGVEED
jgi:NAD(P)-dependent dehydrogenase (short-subunit alcohol dehydrogenase family)